MTWAIEIERKRRLRRNERIKESAKKAMARVRRNRQTGRPVLEQALAELIRQGDIKRHLNKELKIYRQRSDHFCALLGKELRDFAQFQVPEGGMAVWTTFDTGINFDKLNSHAARFGLHINHASVYNPPNKNLNRYPAWICLAQ